MPTPRRAAPTLLLACLLGIGCGGGDEKKVKVYPVKGTVTRAGKPFANALILFHPTRPATADADDPAAAARVARADDKGEFVLSTYTEGDGAPAGDYVVTVAPGEPDAEGGDGPVPPKRVDPALARYAAKEKSPLKATVQAGDNPPLTLDVK